MTEELIESYIRSAFDNFFHEYPELFEQHHLIESAIRPVLYSHIGTVPEWLVSYLKTLDDIVFRNYLVHWVDWLLSEMLDTDQPVPVIPDLYSWEGSLVTADEYTKEIDDRTEITRRFDTYLREVSSEVISFVAERGPCRRGDIIEKFSWDSLDRRVLDRVINTLIAENTLSLDSETYLIGVGDGKCLPATI